VTVANPQNSAEALNSFGQEVYGSYADASGDTFQTIYGTPQEDRVVGTPGNDVIVGVAGNQELIAGGGDNALLGGAGNMFLFAGTDTNHPLDPQIKAAGAPTPSNFDVLVGGPNDVLVGETGQDAFVFGSSCGQNTVYNFDPTKDLLVVQANIDGSGIASNADLERHVADSARGTEVNFGGGDSVLIAGVHPAAFTAPDFAVIKA
jgi:serralysin